MGTTVLVPAHTALPAIFALSLSVLAGLGDAYGFVHAARVWRDDAIVWSEVGRSGLGFALGVCTQWLAIRYLNRVGITIAEVQTLLWFGVTMIGIAVLNRSVLEWAVTDRVVAGGVVFGLLWLVART